ncbi:MAG: cytochrome c oxidase assembly protein [Chloroflexi bacterium]|nr:cytochrome c oxidase assembly protein [Chloroflexota bacterium]
MLCPVPGPAPLPLAHEEAASLPLGWGFDPLVWVGIGLLAALYAQGLRRWRPRSYEFSPWHPVAFYAALAIAFGALQSPLEHLAEELLAAHMVQHLLLTMWVAPLLVLGAPVTPLLRGLPVVLRLGLVRPLARARWARRLFPLFIRPVPAWLLATAALWAWHLPAAYDLALRSAAVHVLQHVTLVLTATFFWAALMDISPLRSRLSYLGRIFFMLGAAAVSSPLALLIILAAPGLYSAYTGAWGLSVAQDQQAAGLIMLVPGDMMYLAGLVVCVLVWLEREEQRAQREAEEQAAEQAKASSAGP